MESEGELQCKSRQVLHFPVDARLLSRLETKMAMDGSLGPGTQGSMGREAEQETRLTSRSLILKVQGPVGKREERGVIRRDLQEVHAP